MNVQDQLAIAQLCLGLALIVFAVVYMHRRTRVDRYRENLFTLRDELFDYMWKNEIPFDLPAYRLMRAFLNGAIRVAGSLSPMAFLAVMFAIRRQARPKMELLAEIEKIKDPKIRARFERTRVDFGEVLLVYLGLMGWILRFAVKLDRFKRAARQQVDRWMDELVVVGNEGSVGRPFFVGSRRLVLRR